MFEATKQR